MAIGIGIGIGGMRTTGTVTGGAMTAAPRLGYYHGVVDGLFGPDTRAALTLYQIDHGLSVTASLNTDTLQSLGIQKIATS